VQEVSRSVLVEPSSCIYETVHGMACHVGRLVAASTRDLALSLDNGSITARETAKDSRISACMSQHDTHFVACSDTE
jgi:hypothetical protein